MTPSRDSEARAATQSEQAGDGNPAPAREERVTVPLAQSVSEPVSEASPTSGDPASSTQASRSGRNPWSVAPPPGPPPTAEDLAKDQAQKDLILAERAKLGIKHPRDKEKLAEKTGRRGGPKVTVSTKKQPPPPAAVRSDEDRGPKKPQSRDSRFEN